MNLFKSNYFERAFAGNGLQSIIYYLRKLVNGFDANTQISDGGGIEGVNDRLDVVTEKLDTLNISVKLDDPDIAATKVNTDTIVSNITSVKTNSDTTTTNVGTIKTDLATVKSDLATVKTNTANTKTSVDTVNTTLGTVKTDTGNIKTNTDTIKSDLATVKADIASTKADVHSILVLLQEHYSNP